MAIDRLKRIVWATAWIACAACTVGPEPRRPDVDTPARYPTTADPARRQALSADLPSRIVERTSDARRWWSVFGDPVLDGLVDDALTQNLDVQQTALRIAEARAQRDATASAFYPEVEASGIAGRSRMSENGIGKALAGGGSSGGSSSGGAASSSSPPSTFNLFQVGFDATWEPDLWGKTRRGVQADAATLRSAEESRHDAMVSLAAEIARAYLTLRGAERQRDIALADIATQEHLRELVDSRNQAGLAPASDVAAQQVQVSASRAQLPQIEQAIAINRNRLALLLAMPPGSLDARLVPQPTTPGSGDARFAPQPMTPGSLDGRPGPHPTPPVGLDARLAARPTPMLPPEVPVGLPGDLLRRRPDVRQREAEAEAATARIGVARAMLFPRVRFGATGGLQATESSNLFDWASRFGIFGAQLSLPIFEGGRLHAQVVIADLRAQEAVLNYRQTVLGAFHDVDNALTTYAQDQHRTVDLSRQLEGANRSRDLAADRYRAGLGAFIDVLTADHQSHQASLDLAQSQVTASTDLVALFKALGGGWDDGDAASR